MISNQPRRVAYYGGSFDPVHVGHIKIARTLLKVFELDAFHFVPAWHAPHKRESSPSSPYHRFAMLTAATASYRSLFVSTIELDDPERPYTIDTISKVRSVHRDDDIFFVIGADSWEEITTWRSWEEVLTKVNIIVVTRPGYEIEFDHVTDSILERIVDLRGRESDVRRQEPDCEPGTPATSNSESEPGAQATGNSESEPGAQATGNTESEPGAQATGKAEGRTTSRPRIFLTDSVYVDVSATKIRKGVRTGQEGWKSQVPSEVSGYIEKYRLYTPSGS
ncbi:MAG: nicotinate (nicotinamide) nucleotide adenylyltransferase [Acidobacteria bacterium]|nr:MAG: nicotinate (nicotinamide) nucleotide adenylyltransferase [Acidobacteriota bacterium]REJ98928.1 MAG: nicotinate (nicotinamide) nucleotide adenylyltransferase [Acidobacteriota bacterium]REK16352.1 MAG: nicotinate (nicotinamide) nucleotide adenylyltransferase [Acidobacteriota bacterium]REK44033.1 MAG: nicotinate (nicotinamide) nucleotide adenylyltransferase [Acidobacteriota bacterium]